MLHNDNNFVNVIMSSVKMVSVWIDSPAWVSNIIKYKIQSSLEVYMYIVQQTTG